MLLEQKDRSLLADIAFAFCRFGVINQAKIVFTSLAVSDPSKDGAIVGLALCDIIKAEYDNAIKLLDERLNKGSVIESQLRLYKLLALGLAERMPEAQEVRRTMEADGMSAAVATADTLLAEMSNK